MIDICLSKNLLEVLDFHNIEKENYVPAYNGESAGLDLYNCGEVITIHPAASYEDNKKSVMIPTGIKINIPHGYVGLIQERGSITKTPLKVRAGVIDTGFTGEVFINCVNTSKENFTIYKYNKLPFQIIVVKCDNKFKIVSDEEYLYNTSYSARKEGQVGSSD